MTPGTVWPPPHTSINVFPAYHGQRTRNHVHSIVFFLAHPASVHVSERSTRWFTSWGRESWHCVHVSVSPLMRPVGPYCLNMFPIISTVGLGMETKLSGKMSPERRGVQMRSPYSVSMARGRRNEVLGLAVISRDLPRQGT